MFEARLFIGMEFRAVLAEAFHGFVEGAAADTGEGFGFVCFAVGEKEVPDVGVEGDFGEEGRDGWEHGVLGLAQGGVIAEGIEVVDQAPGFVEGASGFVEIENNAFEGHAAAVLGQKRVDRGGGLFESRRDIGLDGVSFECGPADMEVGGEERMRHVRGVCLEKQKE